MSLREVLLIVNLWIFRVRAVDGHCGATQGRRGTAVDRGGLRGHGDGIDGVEVWWSAVHLDHIGSVPR
jgi:hypothetical protein